MQLQKDMCCVLHLLPEIHWDICRFFCTSFSPFSSESVAEPFTSAATSASQCDYSGRKISIKLILWRKWKQNFSASGVFSFFFTSWDGKWKRCYLILSKLFQCFDKQKNNFNLKNVKYKKLVIILDGQTEQSY